MEPMTLEERLLFNLLVAAHHRMDQQPDRYPARPNADSRLRWQTWREQQCTR